MLTTKEDNVGFRQVSPKLCFSDNPRFPGKSDNSRFPDFVQADIRYHNRRRISSSPITRSKYNISSQSNLGISVETLQKHLDGGANDIYVISVQTPQLEDWSFPLGHIHRASQGEAGEK